MQESQVYTQIEMRPTDKEGLLDFQELLDEVGAQNNFLRSSYSFFVNSSDFSVQFYKEAAFAFIKVLLMKGESLSSFIKNGSDPKLIDNARVIAIYWNDCLNANGYTQDGKLLFRPLGSLHISTTSGNKALNLNKVIQFITSRCYEPNGSMMSEFNSQKSILRYTKTNCKEAENITDEDLRRIIMLI